MITVISDRQIHMILGTSLLLIFIWSAVNPRDMHVWFMEVLPVTAGVALVLLTYNRFRLTTLVYFLVWIDVVIVLIGGHYTYANMPLFDWLQKHFDLARNYYDRFGHFFQGVLLAILAREVLLRKTALKRGWWLFFICVSISLAASAFYELQEWIAAEIFGNGAVQFLATQGDEWDTQWDMFMALCGAAAALLTLSNLHDDQLKDIKTNSV